MKKPIEVLYEKLNSHILKTGYDKELDKNLQSLVEKVKISAVNDKVNGIESGYCMIFSYSETNVKKLLIGNVFNEKEVVDAFEIEWGIPQDKKNQMYGNSFYHILLLLVMWGLRNNKPKMVINAYTLFLFRIWNGRLRYFVKYCNPDVMAYVTSYAMSKKFLPNKFKNPLELLEKHFVPSLIKKYGSTVKANSTKSKVFLDQGWNRIRQLFMSKKVTNLISKKTTYTRGIAPMYFKSHDAGEKFSTAKIQTDDDGINIDSSFTNSVIPERVTEITNYIVNNSFPEYPKPIIEFIKKEVKLIRESYLIKTMKSIHDINYHDILYDIIEVFFRRIQDIPQHDICSFSFIKEIVRKKIISSKHTPDIDELKKNVNELLTRIFAEKFEEPLDFNKWSYTNKSSFRSIIIYTIAWNIRNVICK